jgi:glycosyltransferase involved in cell wall biosynthesis
MRIGLFFLAGMGGIRTHGMELANIMGKKGHEVHVFSTEDFEHRKEITFHPIPFKRDFGFIKQYDASFTPKLNQTLKELDLDIINLQLPFFSLDRYIPKLKFPCPVIGTVHQCFSGQSIYDLFLQAYYKLFTDKTMSVCDRLICVSKAVKKTLPMNKPSDVVYNGIDTKKFTPSNKKEDYILFVGRILFEKGIHHLLSAYNKVRKQREIELRIIGDGPLRFMLKPPVNYLGVVPKHTLIENYQRAQLGVFPSLWYEAGSRVLLECMACGTPGIAYDSGAFPEIIDNGVDGFLCRRNPKDLAKTIISSLGSDLKTMSGKARKKIEKKFSLEVMYRQTMASYRKLV